MARMTALAMALVMTVLSVAVTLRGDPVKRDRAAMASASEAGDRLASVKHAFSAAQSALPAANIYGSEPKPMVLDAGVFSAGSLLYRINEAIDPASVTGGLYVLRKMMEQLASWVLLPIILLNLLVGALGNARNPDTALAATARKVAVVVLLLWLYVPWDYVMFQMISRPLTAALEVDYLRRQMAETLLPYTSVKAKDEDAFLNGDPALQTPESKARRNPLGMISRFATKNVDCATRLGAQGALDGADTEDGRALRDCLDKSQPGYEVTMNAGSWAGMGSGVADVSQWGSIKSFFSSVWDWTKAISAALFALDFSQIAKLLGNTFSGWAITIFQFILSAVLWCIWLGIIVGRALSLVFAPLAIVLSLLPGAKKRSENWFRSHAVMCMRPVGFTLAIMIFTMFFTLVFGTTIIVGQGTAAGAVYGAPVSEVVYSQETLRLAQAPPVAEPPPVTLPAGYDPYDPYDTKRLTPEQYDLATKGINAKKPAPIVGIGLRLAMVFLLFILLKQGDNISKALGGDVAALGLAISNEMNDRALKYTKLAGKAAWIGAKGLATGGTSLATDAQREARKIVANQVQAVADKKNAKKIGAGGITKTGEKGGTPEQPEKAGPLSLFTAAAAVARKGWGEETERDIDLSDALSVLGEHASTGFIASSRTRTEEAAVDNIAPPAIEGVAEGAQLAPVQAMAQAQDAIEALPERQREISLRLAGTIMAHFRDKDLLGDVEGAASGEQMRRALGERSRELSVALANEPAILQEVNDQAAADIDRPPTLTIGGTKVPDILAMSEESAVFRAALAVVATGENGYFRETIRREHLTEVSGVAHNSLQEVVLHMDEDRFVTRPAGYDLAAWGETLRLRSDSLLRGMWYDQATQEERQEAGMLVTVTSEAGRREAMLDTGLDVRVTWLQKTKQSGSAEDALVGLKLNKTQLARKAADWHITTTVILSRSCGGGKFGIDAERFIASRGTEETYLSGAGSLFSTLKAGRPGIRDREIYTAARAAVIEKMRRGEVASPTQNRNESYRDWAARQEFAVNRLIFSPAADLDETERVFADVVSSHQLTKAYQAQRVDMATVRQKLIDRSLDAGLKVEVGKTADLQGEWTIIPGSALDLAMGETTTGDPEERMNSAITRAIELSEKPDDTILSPEEAAARVGLVKAPRASQVLTAAAIKASWNIEAGQSAYIDSSGNQDVPDGSGSEEDLAIRVESEGEKLAAALEQNPQEEEMAAKANQILALLKQRQSHDGGAKAALIAVYPLMKEMGAKEDPNAWGGMVDAVGAALAPPSRPGTKEKVEETVAAGSLIDSASIDALSSENVISDKEIYIEAVERLKQAWGAGVVLPPRPREEQESEEQYTARFAATVSQQINDPVIGAEISLRAQVSAAESEPALGRTVTEAFDTATTPALVMVRSSTTAEPTLKLKYRKDGDVTTEEEAPSLPSEDEQSPGDLPTETPAYTSTPSTDVVYEGDVPVLGEETLTSGGRKTTPGLAAAGLAGVTQEDALRRSKQALKPSGPGGEDVVPRTTPEGAKGEAIESVDAWIVRLQSSDAPAENIAGAVAIRQLLLNDPQEDTKNLSQASIDEVLSRTSASIPPDVHEKLATLQQKGPEREREFWHLTSEANKPAGGEESASDGDPTSAEIGESLKTAREGEPPEGIKKNTDTLGADIDQAIRDIRQKSDTSNGVKLSTAERASIERTIGALEATKNRDVPAAGPVSGASTTKNSEAFKVGAKEDREVLRKIGAIGEIESIEAKAAASEPGDKNATAVADKAPAGASAFWEQTAKSVTKTTPPHGGKLRSHGENESTANAQEASVVTSGEAPNGPLPPAKPDDSIETFNDALSRNDAFISSAAEQQKRDVTEELEDLSRKIPQAAEKPPKIPGYGTVSTREDGQARQARENAQESPGGSGFLAATAKQAPGSGDDASERSDKREVENGEDTGRIDKINPSPSEAGKKTGAEAKYQADTRPEKPQVPAENLTGPADREKLSTANPIATDAPRQKPQEPSTTQPDADKVVAGNPSDNNPAGGPPGSASAESRARETKPSGEKPQATRAADDVKPAKQPGSGELPSHETKHADAAKNQSPGRKGEQGDVASHSQQPDKPPAPASDKASVAQRRQEAIDSELKELKREGERIAEGRGRKEAAADTGNKTAGPAVADAIRRSGESGARAGVGTSDEKLRQEGGAQEAITPAAGRKAEQPARRITGQEAGTAAIAEAPPINPNHEAGRSPKQQGQAGDNTESAKEPPTYVSAPDKGAPQNTPITKEGRGGEARGDNNAQRATHEETRSSATPVEREERAAARPQHEESTKVNNSKPDSSAGNEVPVARSEPHDKARNTPDASGAAETKPARATAGKADDLQEASASDIKEERSQSLSNEPARGTERAAGGAEPKKATPQGGDARNEPAKHKEEPANKKPSRQEEPSPVTASPKADTPEKATITEAMEKGSERQEARVMDAPSPETKAVEPAVETDKAKVTVAADESAAKTAREEKARRKAQIEAEMQELKRQGESIAAKAASLAGEDVLPGARQQLKLAEIGVEIVASVLDKPFTRRVRIEHTPQGMTLKLDPPAYHGEVGWLNPVFNDNTNPTEIVLFVSPSHLTPGRHTAVITLNGKQRASILQDSVNLEVSLVVSGKHQDEAKNNEAENTTWVEIEKAGRKQLATYLDQTGTSGDVRRILLAIAEKPGNLLRLNEQGKKMLSEHFHALMPLVGNVLDENREEAIRWQEITGYPVLAVLGNPRLSLTAREPR